MRSIRHERTYRCTISKIHCYSAHWNRWFNKKNKFFSRVPAHFGYISLQSRISLQHSIRWNTNLWPYNNANFKILCRVQILEFKNSIQCVFVVNRVSMLKRSMWWHRLTFGTKVIINQTYYSLCYTIIGNCVLSLSIK